VIGEVVAIDLTAAIAVADATVGRPIAAQVIAEAVRSWQPPGGRAVTFELHGNVLAIDDSYNANPGSMRAAMATLDEVRRGRAGRAVLVLGEMRELGPISEREHERLGDELVRRGFDVVIGCGGDIDLTLRRAQAGGVTVMYTRGADEAGGVVAYVVRAGDTVLFKGSRGARVERALATLIERRPRISPGTRGTT
jgi:UDP-N-acetylmuramoyl-tripeptide--D-alanyl-D-alanine ligase